MRQSVGGAGRDNRTSSRLSSRRLAVVIFWISTIVLFINYLVCAIRKE